MAEAKVEAEVKEEAKEEAKVESKSVHVEEVKEASEKLQKLSAPDNRAVVEKLTNSDEAPKPEDKKNSNSGILMPIAATVLGVAAVAGLVAFRYFNK